MNLSPKSLSFQLLMIIGLAFFVATPSALSQKLRERARNPKTGMISWSEWKPLSCERCLGKKKTNCGTCDGGRKKLTVKCGECKGKKKAPCRECFGKGKYVDPFLITGCTRCKSRGAIKCPSCGGKGLHYYRDGRKGPKCKVCKKKGYFKCWVCKSKGNMALMQIEGVSYTKATESQLKKMRAKLKPVLDKLKAFTGVNEDKPKKYFREIEFNATMKGVTEVFPQFKNEAKEVKKMSTAALKSRTITDYKTLPGKFRESAALSASNFLAVHLNIIESALNVFTNNRRQAERNKKRKPVPGTSGN